MMALDGGIYLELVLAGLGLRCWVEEINGENLEYQILKWEDDFEHSCPGGVGRVLRGERRISSSSTLQALIRGIWLTILKQRSFDAGLR